MYFLATLPVDLHAHPDAGHTRHLPQLCATLHWWYSDTQPHAPFDTTLKGSVCCEKVRTVRWPH